MQVSSVNRTEIEIILGGKLGKETVQQLIGVRTVLVDVIARMSARQSLNFHVEEEIILRGINLGVGKLSGRIGTSGTTDEQLALVFRVEVNQNVAIHETFLQGESSRQAGFLVHGEQTFNRTMLDVIGSKYGKLRGDTDAVVRTEGRSFRFQPFSVDDGLNRVVQEIVLHITVLLAHHVDVRLEDDGLQVFLSRSGGFLDEDVSRLILFRFQSLLLSEIEQVGDNLLFLLRRAWHLAYFREITEHGCRFQFYFFHRFLY